MDREVVGPVPALNMPGLLVYLGLWGSVDKEGVRDVLCWSRASQR